MLIVHKDSEDELEYIIQDSIDDIRALIRSLNTMDVRRFSLVEILESYVQRVNGRSSVPLTLSVSRQKELRNLTGAPALHVIRICQEAVSNALRHGGPESVSIRLMERDAKLILTVSDNGCGFDINNKNMKKGIGLISMAQRMGELGGHLKIISRPGEGTEICASFPLFK